MSVGKDGRRITGRYTARVQVKMDKESERITYSCKVRYGLGKLCLIQVPPTGQPVNVIICIFGGGF